MAYDIIGDIHGQAFKLESLLDKLGYWNTSGAWRHPGRTAVFGGNLIDRGPHQFRSIELVRRVIEDGAARAVLGKHEFNAIARHTPTRAAMANFCCRTFIPVREAGIVVSMNGSWPK
jgi:hypothetical protein